MNRCACGKLTWAEATRQGHAFSEDLPPLDPAKMDPLDAEILGEGPPDPDKLLISALAMAKALGHDAEATCWLCMGLDPVSRLGKLAGEILGGISADDAPEDEGECEVHF